MVSTEAPGSGAAVPFESFLDELLGVLTLRFGHDYSGAAGQAAMLQVVLELSKDQRRKLRGVILDCSTVVKVDLRDSDRAKLASFTRKLEGLEFDVQGVPVVIAATHPVIAQRFERQKGQTAYPIFLAPNVGAARRLLETGGWI